MQAPAAPLPHGVSGQVTDSAQCFARKIARHADGHGRQHPPQQRRLQAHSRGIEAPIAIAFPLLCPIYGGQMRLIAFITESAQIRKILDHIGVDSEPSPARGTPLWDDCDAQMDDGVHIEADWDLAAQPAPDFEVDQRINW